MKILSWKRLNQETEMRKQVERRQHYWLS